MHDWQNNRKLWLDALRSNEYTQGRYQLNREGECCCLGVACEVYQKQGPGDLHITSDGEVTFYDGDNCGLPPKVCQWLNCDGCGALASPRRENEITAHTCIGLNDRMKKTFVEIADVIQSIGLRPNPEFDTTGKVIANGIPSCKALKEQEAALAAVALGPQ